MGDVVSLLSQKGHKWQEDHIKDFPTYVLDFEAQHNTLTYYVPCQHNRAGTSRSLSIEKERNSGDKV